MTLAKAKAKTNETFIVQASLMIVTYNRQNMFIVQATGDSVVNLSLLFMPWLNKLECCWVCQNYPKLPEC